MIIIFPHMKLPIKEANNAHVGHTCVRPRICSRAWRALLTPSMASRYCDRVSFSTHSDDSLPSVVSEDDSEASARRVRCVGVTRSLLAADCGIRVRLTPFSLIACACIPAGLSQTLAILPLSVRTAGRCRSDTSSALDSTTMTTSASRASSE
jgi:hypothetical protein